MKEAQLKKYNTSSAIAYLNDKWNPAGVTVSTDTFYHALARSNIDVERVQAGSSHRNRYTQEQLDSLHFSGTSHIAYKPTYELELIKSSEDMEKLRAKHGTIVDEAGLIEEIWKRFHVRYDHHAVRIRMRRGSLAAAGYSMKGHLKVHWFPVAQLDKMRFYRRKSKH